MKNLDNHPTFRASAPHFLEIYQCVASHIARVAKNIRTSNPYPPNSSYLNSQFFEKTQIHSEVTEVIRDHL